MIFVPALGSMIGRSYHCNLTILGFSVAYHMARGCLSLEARASYHFNSKLCESRRPKHSKLASICAKSTLYMQLLYSICYRLTLYAKIYPLYVGMLPYMQEELHIAVELSAYRGQPLYVISPLYGITNSVFNHSSSYICKHAGMTLLHSHNQMNRSQIGQTIQMMT